MSNSVLILGSSDPSLLAEALGDRGFVAVSGQDDGADEVQRYQAIVLAPQANERPAAQVIAELMKSGRAGSSPIIVALGARDAVQRDQCLIAGAHDVSLDGQPDDIAGRVDSAVNGWLRAAPRRQLKATFRAQRGRQFLDLRVTDIDPTGFAIAPVEGLAEGALLRVSVALPDGELLAWGRLSSADGVPGVRLVGMVTDERLRIVSAIRGKPVEAPPPEEAETTGADAASTDHDDLDTSAAVTPTESPAVPVPPMPAAPGPTPPVQRERTVPPPVRVAIPTADESAEVSTGPSAPPTRPATGTGNSGVIRPSGAPAARERTLPPPAAASVAPRDVSIADAIGNALEPESEVAPPIEPTEGVPEAETFLWPGFIPPAEVCAEMLREAATLPMVAERENGPPTHVVLAFARTMSPIEKRAFDATPPTELPETGLAIRCLVHRLRLFTLIDEAASVPTDGSVTVLLDDGALAGLTTEVNAANAELQKAIDGFVATAQTQRIKEVNAFKNTLTRAQGDLKSAVARLRGEVTARGNMALLDVHENIAGAPRPVVAPARRAEPVAAPEKRPEIKPAFSGGPESTPQQRERRRIIGWAIAMVILSGVWAALHFLRPPPRALNAAELAELLDIKDVAISPKNHHAFLVVSAAWKPDQLHRAALDALAARYQLETFTVQNMKGEAVAAKVRGQKELSVYVAAPPAK